MSLLWVPITLLAALLQALRTADQRKLVGEIGNNGANLARYAVGAPVALCALVLLFAIEPVPHAGSTFYLSCILGGIAQIVGTALLLQAIRSGSFAVGSTLAKTEAVQAAVFSAAVLGEHLPALGWLAVGLATAGVLLISLGPSMGASLNWARDPAALAGLASAAFFAMSGVSIRSAALNHAADPAMLIRPTRRVSLPAFRKPEMPRSPNRSMGMPSMNPRAAPKRFQSAGLPLDVRPRQVQEMPCRRPEP